MTLALQALNPPCTLLRLKGPYHTDSPSGIQHWAVLFLHPPPKHNRQEQQRLYGCYTFITRHKS